MNNLTELLPELLAYARAAWKRRWIALGIAWVVCLVGWTVVALLPNKWAVQARIYVDTDTLLAPLLKGLTIEPNLTQQVQVMQRTLLARPNLERVARMSDLDLQAANPTQMDQLIAGLGSALSLDGDRSARNLFSISYTSDNPQSAVKVVQSLLTILIESNVGDNRREMEQAQAFLNKQIADYERQLQQAERRVVEFKQANIGKLPREGTADQALAAAQQQVLTSKRELSDAQVRMESIQRMLRDTPPTLAVESAPVVVVGGGTALSAQEAILSGRVRDLQTSLDNLLLRFTDKHPDVRETRKQLAAAQADLEAEQKKPANAASGGDPTRARATVSNPVYEQMKIRLSDADSNLVLAKQRLTEAEAMYQQRLQQSAEAANLEAKASALNRDYNVIKKQFEELLSRREAARMAQAKDDRRDASLLFRIIEPPTEPTKPVGPPRLLYASGVLIAGFLAGGALAVLLSLLDDSIATVAKLRRQFSYPVLGVVTKLSSNAERRQKAIGILAFGAITAALVLVFGGVLVATPKFPISLDLFRFS